MKNTVLKVFLPLSLVCLLQSNGSGQERSTLNGYIKDAATGETLIGASVYIDALGTGATSNAYGFYSLTVARGTYQVEFSYLGYKTELYEIALTDSSVSRTIELAIQAEELEEVVVVSEAEDRNVSDIQMSSHKLDINTIQRMPTLLGEVELLRSILLLPGVSTVGEGAAGFNVRGGSVDQNLVLLDEAPVYNSSHLFGFYSVFNPDAVKDVQLYKGGIPARYGGRLSSILDVRMKEGNSKRFAMQGGIGFIFSRLSIEAPIVKDKASFIIAGRRSYADILARPFLNDDFEDSALNFYDLTIKANYNIDENNRIFASGYLGRDNFRFGEAAGFDWGNATGTIRWNHLFNERLFSNFTLYYSNYDYQIHFGDEVDNRFDWEASVINYSFKPELTYYINPTSVLRFGGEAIIYDFKPGTAIGISEGEVTDISLDDKYAIESGLYLENELKAGSRWELIYGVRLSHFNYTGKGHAYTFGDAPPGTRRPVAGSQYFDQWESIKTYLNVEPRASVKFRLDDRSSVKASYNRMVQYVHLISNTTASTPVDVWTPSTNNLRPQLADQVAAGYFRNFADNMYELSVETYYKRMDRLVDYIDGADLILNEYLEGDLMEGQGRAYGAELQFKKTKGQFTGWLSYTLARTERKVPGINDNAWYPSRYDQTHSFSLTGFLDLGPRWSLSANFIYNTGTPTTFATTRIEQQGYVIPHSDADNRNNVRIPDYHRLDLSATLNGKNKPDKRWQGQWVFSVYNVYSRRNPFSIFFRQDENRTPADQPVPTEAVQLSVIGNFIPSVSYNFKF